MSNEPLTIETKSGHFALELQDGRVTLRATDKLKNHVREEATDDPDIGDAGLGGRIARLVTGSVKALFDQELSYPLEDIAGVRYDSDRLEFTYREKKRLTFESIREEHHSVLADFGEADAEAFVAAFDAQKTAP